MVQFSWFSLQPSELMKPVTALAIAKYLSNVHSDIKNYKIQFYSFIIILVPIVLILLQPDPGTALIFLVFIWFYILLVCHQFILISSCSFQFYLLLRL